MARSFPGKPRELLHESHILWYRPRAHAHLGPRNDRVYLLWPALAFRVVVAEPYTRRLNLLQKAVLGILEASCLTAEEIATKLAIHRELAAFVLLEQQALRHIDEYCTVTARGREILEDEREQAARLVPGWVFRDPFSERLWPFVAETLEPARTAVNDRGHIDLELGSDGNSWRQSAWRQQPPLDADATPPVAQDIVRAAARHARRNRRARHQGDDWQQDENLSTRVDISRVQCVERRPERVFLSTFLYVPQAGSDRDLDWFACDFFGRGASPALRPLVADAARRDEHLRVRLDPLIAHTRQYSGLKDFREALEHRHRAAQAQLAHALTSDILRHGVSESLVEAFDGWLEICELPGHDTERQRRSVLMACRRTLERALRELARDWPLAGVSTLLVRDRESAREFNPAVFRRAADSVGLARLPEVLTRVTWGQVHSVSAYADSWRLRPLVAATLLAADREPEHPLRAAAGRHADLLRDIEWIAALAGSKAAHDNPDEPIAESEVRDCLNRTIAVVDALLNLQVRPVAEE